MTTALINPKVVTVARAFAKHLNGRVAKPSLKAFFYAYLYVTLPRVFNVVIISLRKKHYNQIIPKVTKILISALNFNKFPMFAARLVAGINILEPLIYNLLKAKHVATSPVNNLFISTLISAFLSSVASFPRYQNHIITKGRSYSLDLTLLAVTRALDTALSSVLTQISPRILRDNGNALLFIVSCTFIMFSWFYRPQALPPAYRKWITSAANMDQEILDALYYLREGSLVYGKDCAQESILDPYCERYGQDIKRGSFKINQPLECEVVHAFVSKSCEMHALWRFKRGFEFSLKVYGPLNALMLLIPMKNVSMKKRIIRAIKSSIRSSCFLGAFISLYWYAVCLTRTRLGPLLFPNIPKTQWDNTLGPAFGSFLCGFSSFIEVNSRRKELALFVAPRALGTIVPVEPTARNLFLETVAFSISMAVLVAYSRRRPSSVRGIFGRGIQQVFSVNKYS